MKRTRSVLLVEDDASDQYLFVEAIKQLHNVSIYDIARNGKEALEKLRSGTSLPDLIFTDINMPVMDGIECLSEIVNDPFIKNIPVVVLSSDLAQLQKARDKGAKAFIKKPSDYHTLYSYLEHVINIDFDNEAELAAQTFAIALS